MDGLLYDPATMNALYDDLQHSGSQLKTEGQNLETNATRFHEALIGDNASASFDSVHKKWADEFSQHLGVLDNLSNSVEEALHRALAADSAVGDGFHVF